VSNNDQQLDLETSFYESPLNFTNIKLFKQKLTCRWGCNRYFLFSFSL